MFLQPAPPADRPDRAGSKATTRDPATRWRVQIDIVWHRRRALRTCRSSRLINQRVDRVPLCGGHAWVAFAADREAVPQSVQLVDRIPASPGSAGRAVP